MKNALIIVGKELKYNPTFVAYLKREVTKNIGIIDMTLFMTHLTLCVSESTYLAHTFPVTTVAFTLVALMSSSVNSHTHN
jgi:hypothetical protein